MLYKLLLSQIPAKAPLHPYFTEHCKTKLEQNLTDLRRIHCESGKELLLQGEAALQTQIFRDAEPQLVIPPVPPVQLIPGINVCLTTTDPCLPIIAWKCNDAYCSWSSQRSNPIGQSFLFICMFHAVWLCLKKCSENRVLVVLLQIGAKDFTVRRLTSLGISTLGFSVMAEKPLHRVGG